MAQRTPDDGPAAATAVSDELRGFLSAALGAPVGDDDDYFELGLASSLFAMELVTFVEQQFGIAVEVDDLDLDNFRTARNLTGFVLAKRALTGAPA